MPPLNCVRLCAAKRHVRHNPNSDRESRHPQTILSALTPKADMCGAKANVFGPKADMASLTRSLGRRGRVTTAEIGWAVSAGSCTKPRRDPRHRLVNQ